MIWREGQKGSQGSGEDTCVPVNRKLWNEWIRETGCPEGWHCPTCSGGYLKLVRDSLRSGQSAATLQEQGEVWFEAEHVALRFSALLECQNDRCKETVAVSGVGKCYEDQSDDRTQLEWYSYFMPLHVYPPLNFIPLADTVPTEVRESLIASFSLVWASPPAAANQVRAAIENLLTVLRVPRAKRIRSVRMAPLTLHRRIEMLKLRNAGVADALFAIKWVGNSGSHVSNLTRDDVFDAYDILEEVLSALFVKHRETTHKLIKEINRRRGPRRKKKQPSLM